ncbi:MAG: Hpt domain-containing protein [Alphaproteobacteria bacterium]|nr:Hpt domain-containing protein [Alphaproteobacteria bacterium]
MSNQVSSNHLNVDQLQTLLNDTNLEVLQMLIEMYLKDAKERIECLSEAVHQNDLARLKQEAHAFKGSSSNFGVISYVHYAKILELETQAITESTHEMVANLQRLYPNVIEDLQNWCRQQKTA